MRLFRDLLHSLHRALPDMINKLGLLHCLISSRILLVIVVGINLTSSRILLGSRIGISLLSVVGISRAFSGILLGSFVGISLIHFYLLEL